MSSEEEDYSASDIGSDDDSEDNLLDQSSEEESEDDFDNENITQQFSAEDTGAEAEIEGDFDRLVQNIRHASDGSSSGILTKMWDINLEEENAEFRDDLRAATGIGKRKKKRGRRAGPTFSQEVQLLIGEGNQAFVDGDTQSAIRIMQEVIRIEPRAAAAWSVLANCYVDLKEPQKALQLRIMAAHLNHDAEEWEQLARESREMSFNQQALYCYRKVYSLDPTNVNVLWDRASLAKDIGDLRTARYTLLAMLKRLPNNLTVLDELRPVLIELSDLALCASLFEDAFKHYQEAFPDGVAYTLDTQAEVPGGGFSLLHVLVLADLYNTLSQYARAVDTIRRGCRWLQGRASQRFWDVCEDDREYDSREVTRGEGELQPGNYPLDVNARHRLAVARIKMGDIEEGMMHAHIILAQDVTEYAPLFGEIADAYFDRELYAEAGRIYEILGQDAGTSSLYVLLRAAACRRMVGDIKEAAEVYEHVITADPAHNEAKMKLAEIYEILNEPRKALDLVMQVINSRRRRQGITTTTGDGTPSDPNTTSLFEETTTKRKPKALKADKLSVAQLRELEAKKEQDVVQGFHRVKSSWSRMLAGEEEAEREWLVEAEKLVETFRETRNLFNSTRQHGFRGMFPRSSRRHVTETNEEDIASRLQLELGRDMSRKSRSEALDNFRTVSFDDWLKLFLDYAFLLTRRGQYEQGQEVLRHVTFSNAYQSRTAQDTLRLALITCAQHAGKPTVAVEHARKIILGHQFNNEPLRILLASLGGGLRATDAFLASTLSKHLLREVRLTDTAVKNKDGLKWNATLKRWGPSSAKVEPDDDDDLEPDDPQEESSAHPTIDKTANLEALPTKGNPVNIAVYGQICLAAKSYQSALFYLLHAYDYCQEDPMICLCLAIASIGRAMQRQADNRHHLITQGMAFISKYRTLKNGESDMDEVEFNFGRAFHQLGLYSLAVKHYERVLEFATSRLEKDPDSQHVGVAREAAYNLSMIYVSTGATPLAEALYRRWLSI